VELAQTDPEVRGLIDSLGPEAETLPLILFPDGARLAEPPLPAVADKIGLRTQHRQFLRPRHCRRRPRRTRCRRLWASEGLHTVMIEREAPGRPGRASAHAIENYLGFLQGSAETISPAAPWPGPAIRREILAPQEAVSIRAEGPYRFLKLADGV